MAVPGVWLLETSYGGFEMNIILVGHVMRMEDV